MLDALLQDLRHGVRHLVRSPGFTAAALVTLALGIGANTAMFSLLNALILRPLPIKDPSGLIAISGRNARGQLQLTPIPAVDELAREGTPFADVCGHNGGVLLSVAANGGATQVVGALVTGTCFDIFGVPPLLGRTISKEDAPLYSRGALVTVISHRLWMRMFGGDPSALGKPIGVEGVELSIIGVMPEGFTGIHADSGIDLYTPFDTWSPARTDRRPAASQILGRLRAGISFEQASRQLEAKWPALLEQVVPAAVPAVERRNMVAATPRIERFPTGLSFIRDRYAQPVKLMFGLTAILLLLMCLNLGGLILARAVERGPEMAMRIALGGNRGRLARQVIVENVMLSLAGSALAIPAALGIIAVITSFIPPSGVERMVTFNPDTLVLTMTALTAVAAGMVMSLLPIVVTKPQVAAIVRGSGRTAAAGASIWTRGLLVAQVGLAMALMIGAGLLGRSLYLLSHVDLGVNPNGVLIASLLPVPNGYQKLNNAAYYPQLLDRLASLPGVSSVGQGRVFPRMTGTLTGDGIAFVGEEPGDVRGMWETTSPAYFQTLGIRLLRGRLTTWADNDKAPHVAVVSERLANSLVPGGDVVGRHIHFGPSPWNQDVEIVGVVSNATLGSPRLTEAPVVYRPILQMSRTANYPSIFIRTDERSAATVISALRETVGESGYEFVAQVEWLADVLARAPSSERMSAALAVTVAGLAGILSFTGVFALLAYSVTRRTREIGLRSAVGAEPAAVIWMVMREGLALTAIGVAVGLPAAYFAARVLSTLTYGVSPADPLTFAMAALVFVSLGAAAGIVPARRAARVDPMVALRSE